MVPAQHGYRVAKVLDVDVRDVLIHEEHAVPAEHAGQDQAEVALGAQIAVAGGARAGERPDLLRVRGSELEPSMTVLGGQVEHHGLVEGPRREQLAYVV